MKNVLLMTLFGLMLAGCQDQQKAAPSPTQQKTGQNAPQALSKDDAIEQLKRDRAYLGSVAQALYSSDGAEVAHSQKIWTALRLDSALNDEIVGVLVIGNLKRFLVDRVQVGDIWYRGIYEQLLDKGLVESQHVSPNLFNGDQLKALSKPLFEYIRSIFNDKKKLTYYYGAFRRPAIKALRDYTHGLPSDYDAVGYIEKLRNDFASLLEPGALETYADFVKKDNVFNQLQASGASKAEIEAAGEAIWAFQGKVDRRSATLFAYRRYVQSGNDRELIELYVHIFDDVLAQLKQAQEKTAVEAPAQPLEQNLTVVSPGIFDSGDQFEGKTSNWYALYRSESGLELRKTNMTLKHESDVGGGFEGYEVSASGGGEALLLLKGSKWLAEGPIDVPVGKPAKDKRTVFEKPGVFKIELLDSLVKNGASEALGAHNVDGALELWVTSGWKPFKTNRYYNPQYMFFSVEWIGDLDRDGQPDFMTRADFEGKAYSDQYLYLSSAAKDGELFGEIEIVSPDGGGC